MDRRVLLLLLPALALAQTLGSGADLGDLGGSIPGSSGDPRVTGQADLLGQIARARAGAARAAATGAAPAKAYRGSLPYVRVQKLLGDAVRSKDRTEISGAFNLAIYADDASMRESLPAIREFLDDPDPYVRYTAATTLFVAGDDTGNATLLELVTGAPAVIVDSELAALGLPGDAARLDLRVMAARALSQYRQLEAAEAILGLYRESGDVELVLPLATLGVRAPVPGGDRFHRDSAKYYGLVNAREFVADLTASFERAAAPDLKVATAWALAEMTGDSRYVEFLIEASRPAVEFKPRSGESRFDASTDAVKYLGSLSHPSARAFLESALGSEHPAVVQYALVNLLFNQPGGSERARETLLGEFERRQGRLGATLMLQIASSVDDPGIAADGERLDRGGRGLWYRHAVQRAEWPIYNWIDDYVVKLRRRGREDTKYFGNPSLNVLIGIQVPSPVTP